MNRTQLACLCLIASAMVLSGLLVVQLSQRVGPNAAEAALVIARENFTLLTANTREDEDSLFVLDNSTGTLLVYRLDLARDALVPVDGLRLEQIFSGENPDNRRRGR
jgi:hypothetical protein